MNDSEPFDSPPDFDTDTRNLHEQYEILRKFFLAALVAMLILSGSLAVFLIRQVSFVQRDLEGVRPQVDRLATNFRQVEEPQIDEFINSLVNYARTHPDFNPILAKYKITPGMAAPVAPAVSPATPAKK
jgi:hypothetical protein